MVTTQVLYPERFAALWRSLLAIGRESAGGWSRPAWSAADLAAREWFVEEALDRDLTVETDRNGNLFAWLPGPTVDRTGSTGPAADPAGAAGGNAVIVGSHLDTAPGGGAYTGALGVVSALLAVDLLADHGHRPRRPVAVAVFAGCDAARFGEPWLGARLLTGDLDPARAVGLRDADGVRLADALADAGVDPDGIGPDPDRLSRMGAFVEPHLDRGGSLAGLDAAVGIGTGAWARGRWRLDITGVGNHAGAAMADRTDPALTLAYAVLAANKEARLRDARATVGRFTAQPGRSCVVPAAASAWLDARAPGPDELAALVEAVVARVTDRAARDGTTLAVTEEAYTPPVVNDPGLCGRVAAAIPGAPTLVTPAGYAAGVLSAAGVPATVLLVRNPAGVSLAPREHATDVDCAAAVTALADVLTELACR